MFSSYAVFSESASRNVLFIWRYCYIRPLSQHLCCKATLDDPYVFLTQLPFLQVIRGHTRSHSILPLTFDRIEIERWGWPQCVSFAHQHRLICNMNYLTRHLTSRDLDLRSNYDIDLLRSICTYIFRCISTKEQDAVKTMPLALLGEKLFAKNHICKKAPFWPFLTSVT